MSKSKQGKPCPVKCPWCGAACGRMCCDSPTFDFRTHHWGCDSLTIDGDPDQSCVCQTIVKMRAEFIEELADLHDWLEQTGMIGIISFVEVTEHFLEVATKYAPAQPEEGE